MKLSERELKIVARMRKYERQWRWGRWMTLFVGVFCAAASIFWAWVAVSSVQSEETAKAALSVALAFPTELVSLGIGTQCFIMAIRDWHGNATRSLLLRLIDAADDEQNRKERNA